MAKTNSELVEVQNRITKIVNDEELTNIEILGILESLKFIVSYDMNWDSLSSLDDLIIKQKSKGNNSINQKNLSNN